MGPVGFGPLHCLLQPVTHGFIGNGPQRFTPAGTGGDHPARHLSDIAYIGQRDQADLIFRRAPAVGPVLFQTVPEQKVADHRDQMTPGSASGLLRYGCRCSTWWRTACDAAGRAYTRGGHSLPAPAGRPGWRRWRWPCAVMPRRSQNQRPGRSATTKRVLVNSAGE